MRKSPLSAALLFTLVAAASAACTSALGGRDDPPPGDGDGDDGKDPDDTGVLPDGSDADAVLPARIRRLSNAEYNAAVKALTGTALEPALDFPPDARQHGFTVNEAQRVDPVLARKLDAAAIALADEVVGRLGEFAPCDGGDTNACASTFIQSFGTKAYRRPLTEEDVTALLSLYTAGSTDADFAGGIHQVVRGILQSPGFLYVTEIGDGSESGTVSMTDHEIASSLAFLLTGSPPDEQLLAAAENGSLTTPEGRATEARRLLSSGIGLARALRIVREWLGIDRIVSTAKDSNIYPAYDGLKVAMNDETNAFITEVLTTSGGSVEDLLGAPWTVASTELAAMYGVSGSGRIDVPDRPGLLNRGAFLSVYAHAHETSPVLRGTAIMRRVGCFDIELPTDSNVEIIPPVPDPTATTRERFSVHTQDAFCANCHNYIDPLGFSFEQFDGMGVFRTTENEKPVDSATTVVLNADFDGEYQNSGELAASIATSELVRECFARYIFRSNAAEATEGEATEESFIRSWSALNPDQQKSLLEILLHFATSDLSIYRSEP